MATEQDVQFMGLALARAREGIAKGQQPFGACLVKDGQVIACLYNNVLASGDLTAHPETQAIRDACRDLQTLDLAGCVMYATCEPCAMCFTVAHLAQISAIVCGARLEDARRFGFGRFPVSNSTLKELSGSPIAIIRDFLRDESIAIMQEWYSHQQ